jgi:hypothetical protein
LFRAAPRQKIRVAKQGFGKFNLPNPHLARPAHRGVRRLIRSIAVGWVIPPEPATCLVELIDRQLADFVGIARNCTSHISLSFITEFPPATTAGGEGESGDGMFLRYVAVQVAE